MHITESSSSSISFVDATVTSARTTITVMTMVDDSTTMSSAKSTGCSTAVVHNNDNDNDDNDDDNDNIIVSSTTIVEENEDWTATCIIYEDLPKSVKIHPTTGFVGTIELPISVLSKTAFFRKVSKEGHYRYFSSGTGAVAILKLEFVYFYGTKTTTTNTTQDHNNPYSTSSSSSWSSPSSSPPPTMVRLQWKEFPDDLLPSDQADAVLKFMTEECNRRLNVSVDDDDDDDNDDDFHPPSSFGICEFCEHEALGKFFSSCGDDDDDDDDDVKLFYQDSEWQLIQLPEKMDHLYHTNTGRLIHPKELARQARPTRTTNTKRKKNNRQRAKEKKDNEINAMMTQENPTVSTAINNATTTTSKNGISDQTTTKTTSATATATTTAIVQYKTVEEFAERTLMERWKYLYTTTCPICMDDDMLYSDGVTMPSCQHFVCEDCFRLYLQYKVNDLYMMCCNNKNPFCCPVETCRRTLPILGFVKTYLTEDAMERVRKWYKDLQFPPCFSLDRCLSPSCGAIDSMRRKPTKQSKDTDVYCDVCHKMWCELCLKRLYKDTHTNNNNNNNRGNNDDDNVMLRHKDEDNICDPSMAIMFCQRYLAASDQKKEACRERYPWIVSYAHSRDLDIEANKWVMENGQICPSCQSGVERTDGCFHMQCVVCKTHFCYECGDELFPPFYGTHHCWEQNQLLEIR